MRSTLFAIYSQYDSHENHLSSKRLCPCTIALISVGYVTKWAELYICTLKFDWESELGDEHGSILLPLLVVLSVAIALVVFLLTQWHSADLQQQEGDECRAYSRHCGPGQPTLPPIEMRTEREKLGASNLPSEVDSKVLLCKKKPEKHIRERRDLLPNPKILP